MANYGYMAKIGGDTSGLQKAIKGLDTDLRGLDREINATNKSIKAANQAGIDSTEMYKQKETELAAVIEKTKEKLDGLKSVEQQIKAARDNGSISAEQYREYQREISNTEAQLRQYETELRSVQQEEKKHNQMSAEFKSKLSDISSAAGKVTDDLKEFAVVIAGVSTAIGAAAAAVGKYAVDVGSSFEGAMSSVKAYSGASEEDFKALEEAAKEAGASTSKSATESANALGYMALAGWDTKEMLEGLNPILRASEAGNADLARTSDLVTDSMSAMGIKTEELSHYLDVCSAAQSNSNTSLTALLEAYINCGGTMRNLNISIEESASWLGILANRGIKASEAGTAFNSILVNLIGANKSASAALDTLGVSAWDSEGNFIGLTETLKLLNSALADCTEQEKSFFEAKIGGKTQMNTLQALISGLNDEYGSLYNTLTDCDGALGDTAQTMQDNLTGAITIMRSALEGVGVEIYSYLEEPLRSAVEAVTELLNEINSSIKNGELSETLEKIGSKLGDLLKKIAEFMADKGLPFLIDGVDKLVDLLSWFVDNSDTVISVITGIGAGFAVWKIGTLVIDVLALASAIGSAITVIESAGIAVTGLTAALSAIPALAVITAVTGITAAVISFTLEAQKANIEAEKISETYVKSADDIIDKNNDLIKSINEAREASEEAAKETDKQIAKADEAKRKLDNLCDSNGKLKDASLDVNEELKILNDTFGLQLTAINGQIQGWNDLKGSYEDYCKSLRANAELEARHASYVNAVGNLQGAKDTYQSNWDMYVKAKKAYETYDGSNSIEYQRLADEVTQAKLNYEQAKSNLGLTQKTIDDYEQFAKENDPDEITRKRQGQYGGMQEEAAKNANPNNTKYTDTMEKLKNDSDKELEALREVLDEKLKNQEITLRKYVEEYGKILDNAGFKDTELYLEYSKDHAQKQSELSDKELQAFADDLDHKLKIHEITQEQYDSELSKYLNSHVNKESEIWWKYYEKQSGSNKAASDNSTADEESQADKDLQTFVDIKNHELKTHQLTQEQYDKALGGYLNSHIDKDSELWNKYYDEVAARETKRAEEQKAKSEKESDEKLKTQKEVLDEQLKNGEITFEEYVSDMRKMLDEAAEKETDLWKTYSQGLADDIAEEIKNKNEATKKMLSDMTEAMTEAVGEIENIRKNAADNIGSGSLFDNVDTAEGTRPIFADLSKRAAEIRQYAADFKKLSEMDNIPPDLLNEIRGMGFDDRRAVVSELLKMTEANRQMYFKDYSDYKSAQMEAAKAETADETSAIAENLGETVTNTLTNINIYDIGAAMGMKWMQGFTSSLSPINAADIAEVNTSQNAGGQSGNKSSDGVISVKTPINIILGTEAISTTIQDILTSSGLIGRGNSRL